MTIDELKRWLKYDRKTGIFTWRRSGNNKRKGARAGGLDVLGYWRVKLFGKAYKGHHLAWAFVYDVWPSRLDHRDRDRSNNRITNLREATKSQNSMNQKRDGRLMGVRRNGKGFEARIRLNGKLINLGTYESDVEAARVRDNAAKKYFGEFAVLNYEGGS